jgi:hypothetical protein
LDEFAGASHYRTKQLASLAWRVSNQRKLHDHVELAIAEAEAQFRGLDPPSPYDDRAPFFVAWETLRGVGSNVEVVRAFNAGTREAKDSFREWLRMHRNTFRTATRAHETIGLIKAWTEMLAELEDEGFIREHLAQTFDYQGRRDLASAMRDGDPTAYRAFRGTACWVQYYMALSFLVSYQDGKFAKPESGDQVDFRHAAYAGIADDFVTDDARMAVILRDMVPALRSSVLTFDEFVRSIP